MKDFLIDCTPFACLPSNIRFSNFDMTNVQRVSRNGSRIITKMAGKVWLCDLVIDINKITAISLLPSLYLLVTIIAFRSRFSCLNNDIFISGICALAISTLVFVKKDWRFWIVIYVTMAEPPLKNKTFSYNQILRQECNRDFKGILKSDWGSTITFCSACKSHISIKLVASMILRGILPESYWQFKPVIFF